MVSILLEILGWVGAGLIVLAYALSSLSILKSDTKLYQLLNLLGALGVASISFYKGAFQPAVLNTIWSGIAIYSLFMILKGNKKAV